MTKKAQSKGVKEIKFKYFPLSFIKNALEKKRQILNTVVFKYIEEKYNNIQPLLNLIEGTQYGYNASASEKGRNKFLRISDIKEGIVNWETVPFCDCKDEKTYKVYKNDILIARTGGTTGKSFLIDNPPNNAIYAGYLIRIRTKKNINPEFIYAFLNSYAYWSQIAELKAGSAQPNVNAEKLKTLLIPNCPVDIQNEVLQLLKTGKTKNKELDDLLKKVDRIVESTESQTGLANLQKSHLKNLRQQILQDAISGKLTADWRVENPNIEPASELLKQVKAEKEKLIAGKKIKKEKALPLISEDGVPFDLPEGWEWCRLGEIIVINYGSGLTKHQRKSDGKYPVFGSNGIVGYHDEFLTEFRAIIIGRKGSAGAINISEAPSWTTDVAYFVEEIQNLDFKYLHYLLKSLGLDSLGKGIKPGLNRNEAYALPIPLPPRAEQRAIVAKVERLMGYVSQLEEKIAQNANNAETLMQAFLGEVFKK